MLKALKGPVFGLFLVVALTGVSYMMALELQAGEAVDTRGRRGLYKMILAWIAETLGATGVLVVGGVLVAVMVAWGVVAVKKAGQAPKST